MSTPPEPSCHACSPASTRFWAALRTAQLRMSTCHPLGMSTAPDASSGGQFQLSICGPPRHPSAFTHAPCSMRAQSSGGTGWSLRNFSTTVATQPGPAPRGWESPPGRTCTRRTRRCRRRAPAGSASGATGRSRRSVRRSRPAPAAYPSFHGGLCEAGTTTIDDARPVAGSTHRARLLAPGPVDGLFQVPKGAEMDRLSLPKGVGRHAADRDPPNQSRPFVTRHSHPPRAREEPSRPDAAPCDNADSAPGGTPVRKPHAPPNRTPRSSEPVCVVGGPWTVGTGPGGTGRRTQRRSPRVAGRCNLDR